MKRRQADAGDDLEYQWGAPLTGNSREVGGGSVKQQYQFFRRGSTSFHLGDFAYAQLQRGQRAVVGKILSLWEEDNGTRWACLQRFPKPCEVQLANADRAAFDPRHELLLSDQLVQVRLNQVIAPCQVRHETDFRQMVRENAPTFEDHYFYRKAYRHDSQTAVPISSEHLDDDELRPNARNYLIAAEGDTTVRAAPSAQRRTSATDRVVLRRIGKDLLAIEREIPPQVMHEGWADSHRRQDWQAAASRLHTLRDAIECLLDLENWVCVDYLPGSALESTQAWIEKVDESDINSLQKHIQDFKKDVMRAARAELESGVHARGRSAMQEDEGAAGGGNHADTGGRSTKERKPRWTTSRIQAGKMAVANTLRDLHASSRKTAVDRSKVREAARRYIGDTGLIDYCIANWFEKVIDEESGGILRRQICSTTGKMVFWLQIGHAEGPSSDSGGGGDAGDPAGDDQETGQAVQAPLKGRREAFQDAAPEAGSSLQLQAEVKRLKTSVHQLEDSLAVHKEYCTGIFEGLFSTLKERESARRATEESMVEILKRYGERIKALERRDREASGSGARGHPRDPGPSNPLRGDGFDYAKPIKPETRAPDPATSPYLPVPSSIHVSSAAVPMGTGVGPGGQFPSLMGPTRASPPLPEGLQRALLAAVQGQPPEGFRGTTAQDLGFGPPPHSSQEAAALVRRLYHDGSPGLYGSHGTLSVPAQGMGVPYTVQRGGIGPSAAGVYQSAPHMADYSSGARGMRHVGGTQGYPSYMADIAQHFAPVGAVPLGGVEGSAATDPRFGTPVNGASRHASVPPAAMQEGGDRMGSRMVGLSTYLTGLHRALAQGDPAGPQGQHRPHTPPWARRLLRSRMLGKRDPRPPARHRGKPRTSHPEGDPSASLRSVPQRPLQMLGQRTLRCLPRDR